MTITIYTKIWEDESDYLAMADADYVEEEVHECESVEDAVDILHYQGLTEFSSSEFCENGWYTSPDGTYSDPYSGSVSEPSAHPSGFTAKQLSLIYRGTARMMKR